MVMPQSPWRAQGEWGAPEPAKGIGLHSARFMICLRCEAGLYVFPGLYLQQAGRGVVLSRLGLKSNETS